MPWAICCPDGLDKSLEEIKTDYLHHRQEGGQLGQPRETRSNRKAEMAAGGIWAGARGFDSRHLEADLCGFVADRLAQQRRKTSRHGSPQEGW